MIENFELAKQLIDKAYELNGNMNEMLKMVADNCSQEEFQNYRKSVAYTINEVFERLIEPISKEHSELDRFKDMGKSTGGSREEDVLYYDHDAPPMLERLYHVTEEDGSKSAIVMHIRKPAKSKDAEDWYCTWSCHSDCGDTLMKSFGVDAVQAFVNATVMLDAKIRSIAADKELNWAGGVDVDLIPKIDKI